MSVTLGPSTGPAPADVSGTYDLTRLRTLGDLGGGGNGLPVPLPPAAAPP